MNITAFWRLLRRPSFLLWIAAWPFASFAFVELAESLRSAGRPHSIEPSLAIGRTAFLFCVFLGLYAGQAIREVQHSAFSFSLPRLRPQFRLGAASLGAIAALSAAAAHPLLGTGLPFLWTALLGLVGFSLGLLDTLNSLWLTFLRLAALIGIALQLDAVIRFSSQNPVAALSAGLTMAAWCGWRTLRSTTFRRRPFLPLLALISFFSLPVEIMHHRERLSASRIRGRAWRSSALGESVWHWVRAALYGASGHRRVGWIGWNLLWIVGFTIASLGFSLLIAFEDQGTLHNGLELAYQSLAFGGPGPSGPEASRQDFSYPAWLVSIVWLTLVIAFPIILPIRRVLPLSRRDLGRTVYWAGSLQLALLTAATAAAFCLLLALLAAQTGNPAWPGHLPNVLVAVLLNAAALPLAQYGRLTVVRSARWKKSMPLLFIIGVVGYSQLLLSGSQLWTPRFSQFGPALEIAALAALILLSQGAYRHRILRYFQRADLV